MLKSLKVVIGVALLSLAANAAAEEYEGLDAMSLAQGKKGSPLHGESRAATLALLPLRRFRLHRRGCHLDTSSM